jgi:hypothetical protein
MAAFGITRADLDEAAPRAHAIIAATPLGEHAVAETMTAVFNEILAGLDPDVLDTPTGRELVRRCSVLCWACGLEACLGAINLTSEVLGRVATPRKHR